MDGIFGLLFDMNGDGRLDVVEQATEFAFIGEMMHGDESDDKKDDNDDDR